jgi:D-glycero-beta-D-manno-heptose 1-phosphate adenylyltransferase
MAVLNKETCSSVLEGLQKSHKKIVFTNGCFDLLHVGHLRYLTQAKALGDILFVGINSNASVRRLKGPSRPLQDEQDRAELLASLKPVDYVCIFEEDTPYNLIQLVTPHILVKGGDWPIESIVGHDLVLGWGGQVLSLQFVPGRSTTSIIEKF